MNDVEVIELLGVGETENFPKVGDEKAVDLEEFEIRRRNSCGYQWLLATNLSSLIVRDSIVLLLKNA